MPKQFLQPISELLREYLNERLESYERLDGVHTRAKEPDSFVEKATRLDEATGSPRYKSPLDDIQDQVGARIVTYFLRDVQPVSETVTKYFKPIEDKWRAPEEDSEFGYFGKHFILFLPTEILAEFKDYQGPQFFELQIHTLFQHAWAEAEHDLGYKPTSALTPLQKRMIAFTAAQAWGADRIFDEIAGELQAALASAG